MQEHKLAEFTIRLTYYGDEANDNLNAALNALEEVEYDELETAAIVLAETAAPHLENGVTFEVVS